MIKKRGTHLKWWIAPDGKVLDTKNLWHYEYILTNITKFKKYGLKLSDLPDQSENTVRKYALTKGFTRVNYSINGGRLTIEAPDNNWSSKLRNAIFDFVFSRVGDIEEITIAVLDSSFKRKKEGTVNWSNRSDDDKMQSIPLITERID